MHGDGIHLVASVKLGFSQKVVIRSQQTPYLQLEMRVTKNVNCAAR